MKIRSNSELDPTLELNPAVRVLAAVKNTLATVPLEERPGTKRVRSRLGIFQTAYRIISSALGQF